MRRILAQHRRELDVAGAEHGVAALLMQRQTLAGGRVDAHQRARLGGRETEPLHRRDQPPEVGADEADVIERRRLAAHPRGSAIRHHGRSTSSSGSAVVALTADSAIVEVMSRTPGMVASVWRRKSSYECTSRVSTRSRKSTSPMSM